MSTQTDWPLIEIQCIPDDLEPLQALCWDTDTLGIHEISSSSPCSFIAYFKSQQERDRAAGIIKDWASQRNALVEIRVDAIRDAGWKTAWHDYFKPKTIGDRFVVYPPWILPEKSDRIAVEIFPGQAFGTGYHESTQLCVELLERLDVNGLSACDAGCGSGILTVVAIVLGVRSIVSFDIDPIAIAETKRNIQGNHLRIEPWLSVSAPDALRPDRFDLVLANLDAPTIRCFHRTLADFLRPGGRMIVSGIVKDAFDEIAMLLHAQSLHLLEQKRRGDWVAMVWMK